VYLKAIGFGWGFFVQQFSQTLIILAVGVVVSCLAVLPPWPFWNKNQLKWLKPVKKD
jgi:signal peptidase complex subunit 1